MGSSGGGRFPYDNGLFDRELPGVFRIEPRSNRKRNVESASAKLND